MCLPDATDSRSNRYLVLRSISSDPWSDTYVRRWDWNRNPFALSRLGVCVWVEWGVVRVCGWAWGRPGRWRWVGFGFLFFVWENLWVGGCGHGRYLWVFWVILFSMSSGRWLIYFSFFLGFLAVWQRCRTSSTSWGCCGATAVGTKPVCSENHVGDFLLSGMWQELNFYVCIVDFPCVISRKLNHPHNHALISSRKSFFFGATEFEANGRQYLTCDGCWVLRRVWTFYDVPKWCTTSGHKQWKMCVKSAVRITTPWRCHLTGRLTHFWWSWGCFWWSWGCFDCGAFLFWIFQEAQERSGWIYKMEWKGPRMVEDTQILGVFVWLCSRHHFERQKLYESKSSPFSK